MFRKITFHIVEVNVIQKKSLIAFGERRDVGGGGNLTELPAISAVVAHDEGRHRFISGSRLELVVGAIFLLALAALQEICLCALNGGLRRGEKRLIKKSSTKTFLNSPIERRWSILSQTSRAFSSSRRWPFPRASSWRIWWQRWHRWWSSCADRGSWCP